MKRLPHTELDRIARIEHGARRHTIGAVVHDAEAQNLDGVGNYFRTSSPDGVGAHGGISPGGRSVQWADLNSVCYHARGANSSTVGFELMGYASQPRWRWLRRRTQLRACANRVAWVCFTYRRGIPRRGRNVWGHVDLPAGGHTDPGPNFPWPEFLRLCRRSYRKLHRTNGRHWL